MRPQQGFDFVAETAIVSALAIQKSGPLLGFERYRGSE